MAKDEVAKAVKKALESARPRTVGEIAHAVGMDYNRLSNASYGKSSLDDDELARIRDHLDLPPHWPGPPPHLEGAKPGDLVSLAGVPLVEIPVVGSVSAGPGVWNVDSDRRMVKVPASLAVLGQIGFIVDGDSMMELLEENDTAVFKEARRARTRKIYLLKTQDDGFIVKKMVYERGDWYAASLNPKYPRKLYPEGAEVVGLLVGYYRVNGRREKTVSDADGLVAEEDY